MRGFWMRLFISLVRIALHFYNVIEMICVNICCKIAIPVLDKVQYLQIVNAHNSQEISLFN